MAKRPARADKEFSRLLRQVPRQEAFNASVYAMNCLSYTPLFVRICLDSKDAPTRIARLAAMKRELEKQYIRKCLRKHSAG